MGMAHVVQFGAVTDMPPRTGARVLATCVALIRCAIFFALAALLWRYLRIPVGTEKLHGTILTALSFLFTLQEFLFFQTRAKLGDPLKSVAISTSNLEEMGQRCQRLKDHLEGIWIWALSSKIIGLVVGSFLFFGVLNSVSFSIRGSVWYAAEIEALLGWFTVFNGAFLTIKTFRINRHIEAIQSHLEVESRRIVAGQAAAAAIRAGTTEDWKEDASLGNYDRLPNAKK